MRLGYRWGYLLAIGAAVSAGPALAYPEYVNSRYGLTALPVSYSNYECADCHVSAYGGGASCGAATGAHPWVPCLNPFGIAYRNSGWSNALRDQDHDGDGTTNGNELLDSSTDEPTGSAGFAAGAEAYCDMLACATSAGTSVGCAGDVRCTATRGAGPASTGANPTSNHYAFSFTCEVGTGPAPALSDTDWSDRCLDIDECSGNPCGAGACTQRDLSGWTSPGYDCACPSGWADNGTTCVLVDACLGGTDLCVPLATCNDTPGSSSVYTCECPQSMQGNGLSNGTGCTNINECASSPCGPANDGSGPNGNGCTERSLGLWTAPGYDCACAALYVSDGTQCVVADDCERDDDDCVAAATCVDPGGPDGTFSCDCPEGFDGDGRASGTGCTGGGDTGDTGSVDTDPIDTDPVDTDPDTDPVDTDTGGETDLPMDDTGQPDTADSGDIADTGDDGGCGCASTNGAPFGAWLLGLLGVGLAACGRRGAQGRRTRSGWTQNVLSHTTPVDGP